NEHYRVISLENKIQRRFQALMTSFPQHFPDQQLFQEYRVAPRAETGADVRDVLGDVWEVLQADAQRRDSVEGLYRGSLFPAGSFARMMQRRVVETIPYLTMR